MSLQDRTRTLLKVIIIGDSGVGKTSLLQQFVNHRFDGNYKSTIGTDFLSKDIHLSKLNRVVSLQIWDTSGQERFHSLGAAFWRGAEACVFVFDLTDELSFEHLDKWKQDFKEYNKGRGDESFPYLLIGNKLDLVDKRQISQREALIWCKEHGDKGVEIPYIECSAKDNTNVNEAFVILATEILERYKEKDYDDEVVRLMAPQDITEKEEGCGC